MQVKELQFNEETNKCQIDLYLNREKAALIIHLGGKCVMICRKG